MDGDGFASTAPVDPAAHLRADPEFTARLYGDDYRAREAAEGELSRAYQRAYPEAAADTRDHQDGRWSASQPDTPDTAVPPSPDNYVLPLAFEDAPKISEQLRLWAHGSRLTVAELSEVGRHVVRLAEDYADKPMAHVLEAMGQHTVDELSRTTAGKLTLQRARAAWSRLEHRDPELAEALHSVGASADMEFVKALARTPTR